jgi:UDP-N-acetylglucosamine--N-acetylmuramyl-(pentapeptide) pyrophosphoryl-undecaprenol N-acetylglucosamine transferase
MGSRYGIESNYFNNNSSEEILLNIRGIQRQFNRNAWLKNCLFPYRFIQSYMRSRKIISEFKPHVVIGTGGYSSGLPLLAAIHKGVKTVIQEQNSFPGMTTRRLGTKVNKVCIGFEEAKGCLKKKNVILTGNPIREDIRLMDKAKAKQLYKFDSGRPVLAILGGSQGSAPFNLHFQKHLEQYIESNIQILWQCGKKDYSDLKYLSRHQNIHIIPFTENIDVFYSAADLIVSRSGALALSEMALLGKAMVLIPLPRSAGDHQTTNARTFSKVGGAVLINQASLVSGALEKTILELIQDNQKIARMEENSKKRGIPYATEKITATIMQIAEG